MNDKIRLLELAYKKIASNNQFMAYYLAQYVETEQITINIVIEILGCNVENFYKLGLCKAPTVGSINYLNELNKIADYTSISTIELNKILRRVDTVMKFRNSNTKSYLMAARDKNKKNNDQDDLK